MRAARSDYSSDEVPRRETNHGLRGGRRAEQTSAERAHLEVSFPAGLAQLSPYCWRGSAQVILLTAC
jgi:hypothetical protein